MAFDPVTGPDYARVKTVVNNSKFQQEQNAAYQAFIQLTDGLKKFQDIVSANFGQSVFADDLTAALGVRAPIKIVEVDVSAGPESVVLVDECSIVGGLVIIKDYTGNAGTNTITLTGTVETVVNPTITANYGIFRVYLSAADGEFHTW